MKTDKRYRRCRIEEWFGDNYDEDYGDDYEVGYGDNYGEDN